MNIKFTWHLNFCLFSKCSHVDRLSQLSFINTYRYIFRCIYQSNFCHVPLVFIIASHCMKHQQLFLISLSYVKLSSDSWTNWKIRRRCSSCASTKEAVYDDYSEASFTLWQSTQACLPLISHILILFVRLC